MGVVITVLPQRSRASILAFLLSKSLTTSRCPSHAAICNAVRPSKSMLFTSIPSSFNKSSTPLASPLHAMNSSCIVASKFSGTVSSVLSPSPLSLSPPPRRIGSSDDCRPKLNRWLFRRGSSEACRVNCRLSVLRSEPVENCRDIPRFNCDAKFSIIFLFINSNSNT